MAFVIAIKLVSVFIDGNLAYGTLAYFVAVWKHDRLLGTPLLGLARRLVMNQGSLTYPKSLDRSWSTGTEPGDHDSQQ